MAEPTTSRITEIGAPAPDEALDTAKEHFTEAESAVQRGAASIIDGWAKVLRVFVPPVLARRGALFDVTFDLAQSSLNVSRSVVERLISVTGSNLGFATAGAPAAGSRRKA